jgi:hypothetical protein
MKIIVLNFGSYNFQGEISLKKIIATMSFL